MCFTLRLIAAVYADASDSFKGIDKVLKKVTHSARAADGASKLFRVGHRVLSTPTNVGVRNLEEFWYMYIAIDMLNVTNVIFESVVVAA